MNVDLVTVGDLFYDQMTAERTLSCLRRYQAKGIEILIGDPGRAFLPTSELTLIASYPVPDFAEQPHTRGRQQLQHQVRRYGGFGRRHESLVPG